MGKNYNWITGPTQGSVVGPLSNIINAIFLYIDNLDLCNYPDDSTLYASEESLSIIKENLKANFLKILKWFYKNLWLSTGVLGGPNYT